MPLSPPWDSNSLLPPPQSDLVDEDTLPGFILCGLHALSVAALLLIPSSLFDHIEDTTPTPAAPSTATKAGAAGQAFATPPTATSTMVEAGTWAALYVSLFGGVPAVAYSFLLMNFGRLSVRRS